MADRILGPTGGKRRRRLLLLVPFALIATLILALSAAAGPVGDASGFEDDDGNLVVNSTFDWNGFAPTTWEGTAPYRTTQKIVNGWDLRGLEDAQATTSDTAFAGGTKQDDACATVNTGKAPNKDDLKRIYVSSNTVSGDVFLNLAWVRIPQNTTSPSAHVGFEFNQSETVCPAGSDGLVERTAGDMLIVYDFTGGAADTPTLTMGRWLTDPTDPDQADFFTDAASPCEVDSNSPPCWGDFVNLTDLGFAEARVNTSAVGPVNDNIAPTPPALPQSLGLNEFGEAGINLTEAGVFEEGVCLAFGKAFGVSRSSGNSGTAQMKDLVGPGDVNVANCGRVIIRKVTDPTPDTTDTSFAYTTTGGLDPSTFSLKDGEAQDYGSVVFAGSYSVTETDPSADGFDFTSLDCSASDTSHGTTIDTSSAPTVSFDLKALDTVDCTYTNTARGTIIVEKITDDGTGSFDFTSNTLTPSSFTLETTAAGNGGKDSETFSNLVPGTYDVAETVPAGWNLVSATCDDGSDPSSIGLSAGETVTCTFHDARQKGAILITKTRKHAADGPGDHPHPGVTFTITGGELAAGGVDVVTDANGEACYDGLVLSSFVGDYTVTETVPDGYVADGDTAKTVTVSMESTCDDGNEAGVSFRNTPLTDLSIDVTSQVSGGTQSTIDCENAAMESIGSSGAFADPAELDVVDLEPGTYTCTIVIDP